MTNASGMTAAQAEAQQYLLDVLRNMVLTVFEGVRSP
jgi:hypothetical protein